LKDVSRRNSGFSAIKEEIEIIGCRNKEHLFMEIGVSSGLAEPQMTLKRGLAK
jgi:hypothetical protein